MFMYVFHSFIIFVGCCMRYLGETFMQIFVELFCRNDIQ